MQAISIIPNAFVPDRQNAVPCQYNGINFRSLLEARWAYFFDKLNMKWEYEPFELDSYIPDFVITQEEKDFATGEKSTWKYFVDVKPFFTNEYMIQIMEKLKCLAELDQFKVRGIFVNSIIHLDEPNEFRDNICLPFEKVGIGGGFYLSYDRSKNKLVPDGVNENFASYTIVPRGGKYFFDSIQWAYPEMFIQGINDPVSITCGLICDRSYWESHCNLLMDYWKEAQNATQYRPKTPKQFIKSCND